MRINHNNKRRTLKILKSNLLQGNRTPLKKLILIFTVMRIIFQHKIIKAQNLKLLNFLLSNIQLVLYKICLKKVCHSPKTKWKIQLGILCSNLKSLNRNALINIPLIMYLKRKQPTRIRIKQIKGRRSCLKTQIRTTIRIMRTIKKT